MEKMIKTIFDNVIMSVKTANFADRHNSKTEIGKWKI